MGIIGSEIEIAINVAAKHAHSLHHEYITLEHLLYAILMDKEVITLINANGGGLDTIKEKLNAFLAEQPSLPTEKKTPPTPSVAFQRVVQKAAIHLQSAGKGGAITPVDVLIAMYDEPESYAVYFLEETGILRYQLIQEVSHGELGGQETTTNTPVEADKDEERGNKSPRSNPLDLYAVNLVDKALAGKIDPIIGREAEIKRTIQTLCRRQKNNPLFIGDSGVGKTAIAEGLAKMIAEGKVPDVIKGSTIYSLDMGALLAGTKYRGDFELRLKGVVNALKKEDKAILFIDEIHTLVGSGAVSGGAM
ncbi:MAG: AAA family ATPase, partial [Nitrospinae bacterium]|nr:AAA family ATPase [Nitrospinota bacterium]